MAPQLRIPPVTVSLTGRQVEATLEAISTAIEEADEYIAQCDERDDVVIDHRGLIASVAASIRRSTPEVHTVDVLESELDGYVVDLIVATNEPTEESNQESLEASIDEAWTTQRLIWNVESMDLTPDDWETLADACWATWESSLEDHDHEPGNIRFAADVLEAWRFWVDRLSQFAEIDWEHPGIRSA